ncbi:LytTR family DNA-binding domain-containing protein [Draconibacterium sp. IB214405]|uniref:LytR/AlgR family response regulator transcription factor n=1 Tax=Draconibacterium sp. IB214405 TaxID=3097352 RepID=UPI002A0FB317|nr:LytTR family DNA-binding domain-containing protein [Draconibacterium sp. IB214405]MDX8337670.1 LytTR family DNA-binding domain-containing protein [Draconibacterium sp. IB214405]
MIKAVIVEDEKYSVLNLTELLEKYTHDVQIVEVFESGRKALEKLPQIEFDLLFLDIQFNDNFDAFEMLNTWQFDQLHVIFVTSYNQYALKAFKHNAIDYVTKPIDKDDLISAINKARHHIFRKKELDELFKTIQAFRKRQVAIKGQHETVFVPAKSILYLEAEKDYSTVHFINELNQPKELITSKHLGYWESELEDYPFIRIHKSYLVNMDQVQSYNTRTLKLYQGTKLDIARDRRKDVQNRILAYKTLD